MNVVWLILKIIGLTLAGALALILIALLIPAVLEISYRHKKLNITLKYIFFRFRLLKADVAKPDDEEALEEKAETGEEKEKKKKVKLDIGIMLKLLKPGGRAVWYVTKRLRVYDICVRAVAKGADCAEVGIHSGRIWAATGALCGAVNSVWPKARYKEWTVIPDFVGGMDDQEKYGCKIAALPIIIVIAGLGFVVKYIKISNEHEKENMAQKANKSA